MNIPPKFSTICKVAGLSSEEIDKQWLATWQDGLFSLFKWLVNQESLNDNQLDRLTEQMQQAVQLNECPNYLALFKSILTPQQFQETAEQLDVCMFEAITQRINLIKKGVDFSTLQVINSL